MTIENILSSMWNKESKYTTVLVALWPILPKMLGIAARDARQKKVNNDIPCELMEVIFAPMVVPGNSELEVAYTDGRVPLCFPRLAAWIADHLENVKLHGIQQNQCAVCEVRPKELGSHSRLLQLNEIIENRKICSTNWLRMASKLRKKEQVAVSHYFRVSFVDFRMFRNPICPTRYFPGSVTGNIRNTPYEIDTRISKEVQAAANISYYLEEFSCLSWLFRAEQRVQSDL